MPASRSTSERAGGFVVPPFIHTSQTVIYAPQYFINTTAAPPPPFAPTVVTFPPTPTTQTFSTSYVCYSSTTTTSAHFPLESAFQILDSAAADEYHLKGSATPLSTYRFPSSLVATEEEDHNRISELTEDECLDYIEGVTHASICLSNSISDTGTQLSRLSGFGNEPKSLSGDVVVKHNSDRPFPGKSSSRSTGMNVEDIRVNRADKLPVTPQSILLMRRPSQPKTSMTNDMSAKRSKKTKAKHACKLCDQSFTRAHDLKRHSTIHEKFKAYPCPYCSKAFGRKDALTRHLAVRGTNHNDFTKKASAKPRPRTSGLPKLPQLGRMSPVTEEPQELPTNSTDNAISSVQQSEHQSSTVDVEMSMISDDEEDNEGLIDASDEVTEPSSRASSVQTADTAVKTGPTATQSIPQPFNIDRKWSLVQGLPSAHLHLHETDLLHPFMDPFTTHCGL